MTLLDLLLDQLGEEDVPMPSEVSRRLSLLHPRWGHAPWETHEQWEARLAEAEAEWAAYLMDHPEDAGL